MLTLIPPVEAKLQPWLACEPCSWYCQRSPTPGVQHAPTPVSHGTGAAHPAVAHEAFAAGAATTNATQTARPSRSVVRAAPSRFMAGSFSTRPDTWAKHARELTECQRSVHRKLHVPRGGRTVGHGSAMTTCMPERRIASTMDGSAVESVTSSETSES